MLLILVLKGAVLLLHHFIAFNEISKLLLQIEELIKRSKYMCYYDSPALKLKKNLLVKQRKLKEIINLSKKIQLLNIDWSKKQALERPLGFSPKCDPRIHKVSKRCISNCNNTIRGYDLKRIASTKGCYKESIMRTNLFDTPNCRNTAEQESSSLRETFSNYIQLKEKKTSKDFSKDKIDSKQMIDYNKIMLNGYSEEGFSGDRSRTNRHFSVPVISYKLLENSKEEVVNTKPIVRRHNSFEEELMSYHQYEELPQLSVSCTMDKMLPVRNRHLLRKANSFEYKEKQYMEDPKK